MPLQNASYLSGRMQLRQLAIFGSDHICMAACELGSVLNDAMSKGSDDLSICSMLCNVGHRASSVLCHRSVDHCFVTKRSRVGSRACSSVQQIPSSNALRIGTRASVQPDEGH